MKKLNLTICLIILILPLFSLDISAITQTGNIKIKVISFGEESIPLEGVRVIMSQQRFTGSNASLPANAVRVSGATDKSGYVVFRALNPGIYNAFASMGDYKSRVYSGIDVRIAKTSVVTITLSIEHDIDFEVTATPLYSPTNTVTHRFDTEHYVSKGAHSRRHYTAISGLAPGTLRGNNPSVFGAGGAENLYLIDNFSLTDSRSQKWGRQFNIDTIAEVSVQQAGIPAEYGYMTGSVMDIVTRSGSNRLSGIFRLDITRPNWNDLSEYNPERFDDNIRAGSKEDEWNISGGGPLFPGKAWWYISYTSRDRFTTHSRRLNPLDPGESTSDWKIYTGYYFSAKGTAQLTDSLRLNIYYLSDPVTTSNVGSYYDYSERMQPEADLGQEEGGKTFQGSLLYAVNPDLFIEAKWAHSYNLYNISPQKADDDGNWIASTVAGPSFSSLDDWWWGASPDDSRSKRYRDSGTVSVNLVIEDGLPGNHDIKVGIEYMTEWSVDNVTIYLTGEFIETAAAQGIGFDNVAWLSRYLITDRLPEAENSIRYWTGYIQDSFEISDSLTLNIGFRSDIATGENNQGESVLATSLLDTLAPRIGFALALGDHSLFGSYSRYYDLFSLYIIDNLNTYTTPERWELYEPADGQDGRNGWSLVNTWSIGDAASPNSVDPDLTPQYADEFSLGFDYILGRDMTFSINGIWRVFNDLVIAQDMDGDHIVHYENLRTDAYGSKWKEYKAIVLKFRGRALDDELFISAHATFSSIEGLANDLNDTGTYGTNPLQRYDNTEEWWGPVSTMRSREMSDADPTFTFRLNGTYYLFNWLYVSMFFNLDNNYLPYTWDKKSVSDFGKVVYYPNGRGDMERLPFFHDLAFQFGIEEEIHLPFGWDFLGEVVSLGIYLNIDNATSDQSYYQIDTFARSSSYGDPRKWRSARSYMLGFRLEF